MFVRFHTYKHKHTFINIALCVDYVLQVVYNLDAREDMFRIVLVYKLLLQGVRAMIGLYELTLLLLCHPAENLAVQLSEAITCGDKDEAKQCAEKLAALYLPVSVKVDQKAYPPDTIRYEGHISQVCSQNMFFLCIKND